MKKKETPLSTQDKSILKIINRRKLSGSELENILKSVEKTPVPSANKPADFSKYRGKHLRFGIISDSHIGSVYFDGSFMKYAVDVLNKNSPDFVIHGGDVCEGHYEGIRDGSVFELEHIGGDAQIERAVKELGRIKSPIKFITGNHEYNTFYRKSGIEIGKTLQRRLTNSEYLGNGEGWIILPHKKRIQILHPDGGTAYAISYRPQKIAESITGGSKPDILTISHFHKLEYLFYRNIHILQTGTLENQTKFMKGRHISAHKGFIICDVDFGKDGISKFSPTFYPGYKDEK